MYKSKILFYIILLLALFTFNCVYAKSNINNEYNIKINDNNYNILRKYMNDKQIEKLSPKAYSEIMSGNVESYQSTLIATTYYFNKVSGRYSLIKN